MFEGWGAAAVGVGVVGAAASAYSANKAAGAQSGADQDAIDEQSREFDKVQQLLSPYSQAATGSGTNTGSLTAQEDLIGLNGNDAQASAIDALQKSPQFTSLNQQGQTAILQNASATGGVRGGNTEAALAQFSPQLLNSIIQQQYERLGGITSLGQASAAGTAAAAQNQGNATSSLLADQGAAQAGGYLAQGKAVSGIGNSIITAGVLGNKF